MEDVFVICLGQGHVIINVEWRNMLEHGYLC